MKRERISGLDLVRWVSFLPVVMFHFMDAVWGSRKEFFEPMMSSDPLFWDYIYKFMRALSFSGFSIFVLTFFLMGLTSERKKINWPLIVFLPIGWVLFCWAYSGFTNVFIFWDVYPLIALSLLILQPLFRYTKVEGWVVGFLGFVITSIPFWEFSFFSQLSLRMQMVLVGNCESHLSSWPTLPWVGLAFFGYGFGQYFKPQIWSESGEFKGLQLGRSEAITWAVLLITSLFFWGPYYEVNLNSLYVFDCLTFRQAPLVFWSHLIWIVFFSRLSLVPTVQSFCRRNFASVSQFATSKHFAFIYFYSFVLASAVATVMSSRLQSQPNLFTLFIVLYWVFVEITSRPLLCLLRRRNV